MTRWLLRLLLGLACIGEAAAQTKFTLPPPAGTVLLGVQVVTTCGAASGLANGNSAFVAMDTTGALCTNSTGGGGGSVTQGTSPWVDNVTQWASTALAVPTAWGTPPSGNVIGANVNIAAGLNANGQAVMANSAPVTFASDQAGTCTLHAFKHITTATDTLAVQGVAAQTIRLCAWKARAAGVATWFWENTASANANCSSANTQISGVATEAANTGEAVSLPLGVTLNNTSGNGLCINSTGTGGVDIDFWYAQR